MIKIGIADDHPILRSGIVKELASEGCQVLFEADDGSELLEKLASTKKAGTEVNVVVLDISMKPMNGTTCLKKIKELYEDVKVIIMSNFDDNFTIKEHWDLGASCYVLKTQGAEFIAKAIKEVHESGFYITSEMLPALTNTGLTSRKSAEEKMKSKLTPKELEMINLMYFKEYSSKELGVHFKAKGPGGIDNAKSTLYKKFRNEGFYIHGELGLMRAAVQFKLIDEKLVN